MYLISGIIGKTINRKMVRKSMLVLGKAVAASKHNSYRTGTALFKFGGLIKTHQIDYTYVNSFYRLNNA